MLHAICFNLDQSKILSFGNGLKRKKIEENEENSGHQYFVFSQNVEKKRSLPYGNLYLGMCGKQLTHILGSILKETF